MFSREVLSWGLTLIYNADTIVLLMSSRWWCENQRRFPVLERKGAPTVAARAALRSYVDLRTELELAVAVGIPLSMGCVV